MSEEIVNRGEGEVAPEVAAARRLLLKEARRLAREVEDPASSPTLVEVFAEGVLKWLRVLQHPRPRDAFWQEVRCGFNLSIQGAEEGFGDRDLASVVTYTRRALQLLRLYAEVLGVELPPEEEPAAKEPPPVGEERPWEALDLTEEQWRRPLAEVLDNEARYLHAVGRALRRSPLLAGPALRLLNEVGWEPGAIRNVGEKGLAFLRSKFAEAGYPVPEPRRKGLPRGRGGVKAG